MSTFALYVCDLKILQNIGTRSARYVSKEFPVSRENIHVRLSCLYIFLQSYYPIAKPLFSKTIYRLLFNIKTHSVPRGSVRSR